jgi:hypothetical protein
VLTVGLGKDKLELMIGAFVMLRKFLRIDLSRRRRIAVALGAACAITGALAIGPNADKVGAQVVDDTISFWRAEQARIKQARAARTQPTAQPAAQQRRSAQDSRANQRRAADARAQRQADGRSQPQTGTEQRSAWRAGPPGGAMAYAPAPSFFFGTPNRFSGVDPFAAALPASEASRLADSAPRRRAPTSNRMNARAASSLVCVRACDGFFFPAPDGARSSQESCARACPEAQTSLYSMRSDNIADALAIADRRPYSALTTAFAYTRARNPSCSCGVSDPMMAILRDPTLRRGDRFMTDGGFVIFQGQSRARHASRDFQPLAKASRVPAAERRMLMAMEQVSRVRPPARMASGTVAPQAALGPPRAATRVFVR